MITCFLIDDDRDDHDFFDMALKQLGTPIVSHFAENGREALNVLPSLNPFPDVIFLDVNMPVMGGLEFLQELNKSDYKAVPVIMYSTSDEDFFKEKSLSLGATSYFSKPARMADLIDGIQARLKQLSLL